MFQTWWTFDNEMRESLFFGTIFSYFFCLCKKELQKVNDRCAPPIGSTTKNHVGKVAQKVWPS